MSCASTVSFDSFWNIFIGPFFCSYLLCFSENPHNAFLSFFFPLDIKSTVCGGGHENEAGRERKKKEVGRGERNDEFFSNI
jgi:hypothetical protein